MNIGEVPERPNGVVSKTTVHFHVPRVRIPPSPFILAYCNSDIIVRNDNFLHFFCGILWMGFTGKQCGFPAGVTAEVKRPAGSFTEAPEGVIAPYGEEPATIIPPSPFILAYCNSDIIVRNDNFLHFFCGILWARNVSAERR